MTPGPDSAPAPSPAALATGHPRTPGRASAPKPGPKPQAQPPKPGPQTQNSAASTPASTEQEPAHNHREPSAQEIAQAEAVAAHPFVALTVQTTGIHPSTARLVAIDALTFNAQGEVGQEFHAVVNPDIDPGPRHLHGLTPEEVARGQAFSRLLKPLDRLIDGRTLIVHDTPFTWGFIVSEARRAMMAAARQNRSRNRNRNKGRRRRQKVGHVPTPVTIVDTLATARRQGVWENDIRLAAVAKRSGLDVPPPTATTQRAQRSEAETSREATHLLYRLYRLQAGKTLSTYAPDELRADRFGLQRSHVRVDAAEAPRQHHNPGKYQPGKELRRGMEIVVAPEILEDPDTIISALGREELNYSEKLTRETSLVVCNVTTDLVGKPMHAHRKDIPLMSDTAFLAALERIEEAQEPEPKKEQSSRHAHVPNSNNRRSSNANRRRSRRKSSSATGKPANPNAQVAENKQDAAHSTQHNPQNKPQTKPQDKSGSGNGNKRRRRRGGRGGRGRHGGNNSAGNNSAKNQNSGQN